MSLGQLLPAASLCYVVDMTKLLDKAVEAVRKLPASAQDEVAAAIFAFTGSSQASVDLTPDEIDAIARSKAAAARGEYASEEQVQAVWSKHGL